MFRGKWSLEDRLLLIRLVSKHIDSVESGNNRNFQNMAKKKAAWNAIEEAFRASSKCEARRQEIQITYFNMKNRARIAREKVGPKGTLEDPTLAAIEEMLQNLEPNPILKDVASCQSTDKSCTYSDEENASNSSSDDLEEELRPPMTSHSTQVDYCPRREFCTSTTGKKRTFSEISPHLDLTPDPSRGHVTVTGQRGSLASQHHSQAVKQSFNQSPTSAFETFRDRAPAIQRSSCVVPGSSNAPVFQADRSPGPSKFHQRPLINAMRSLGRSPQIPSYPLSTIPVLQRQSTITPGPQSSTHFSSYGIIPQSPLHADADDASRVNYLQKVQAQLQIRYIETLNSMGKSLHEEKMRTEEMHRRWAKKLLDAQMHTNAVILEAQLATDKMLQRRDEELHLARMRAEEINANMQKELQAIKMETAVLERDQAIINKGVFQVKLKKVEQELQQFH